ncbi:MAG: hypothetical protein HC842_05755 [Cytophagales bacterium]|nr:hypothetical protein [Cytophagales bacterium]
MSDVPTDANGSNSFAIINAGSFDLLPDSLANGGKGYNYGLELTLERFLERGLYYLITASVFESQYAGSDGVWRNTAYNGHYVVNALAGKEWTLSRGKAVNKLVLDGKATVAGGRPYSPVDEAASQARQDVVYQDNLAFTERFDTYFRLDARLAYRREGRKVTQEWAIETNNLTNHQNPFRRIYTLEGEVRTTNQLGRIIIPQYRIYF